MKVNVQFELLTEKSLELEVPVTKIVVVIILVSNTTLEVQELVDVEAAAASVSVATGPPTHEQADEMRTGSSWHMET